MIFILIWGKMKYEVIGYNVIDHKSVSTYSNNNFELLFFFSFFVIYFIFVIVSFFCNSCYKIYSITIFKQNKLFAQEFENQNHYCTEKNLDNATETRNIYILQKGKLGESGSFCHKILSTER